MSFVTCDVHPLSFPGRCGKLTGCSSRRRYSRSRRGWMCCSIEPEGGDTVEGGTWGLKRILETWKNQRTGLHAIILATLLIVRRPCQLSSGEVASTVMYRSWFSNLAMSGRSQPRITLPRLRSTFSPRLCTLRPWGEPWIRHCTYALLRTYLHRNISLAYGTKVF